MRMKIKMLFDKIYNFFSSIDIVLDLVLDLVLHIALGTMKLHDRLAIQ
jgi:hypothetical protein